MQHRAQQVRDQAETINSGTLIDSLNPPGIQQLLALPRRGSHTVAGTDRKTSHGLSIPQIYLAVVVMRQPEAGTRHPYQWMEWHDQHASRYDRLPASDIAEAEADDAEEMPLTVPASGCGTRSTISLAAISQPRRRSCRRSSASSMTEVFSAQPNYRASAGIRIRQPAPARR